MNSFFCTTTINGKETLLFQITLMGSYQQTFKKALGGFFTTILDNQNSFISSNAAFIMLRKGRKGYIK